MDAVLESVKKMTADGKRLELPADEHFGNYAQVKKCLIKAGGMYEKCGFTFFEDAQIVKDRLLGGEKIDDKKKFQFFATPDILAKELVELAMISSDHAVLEPSAGRGAIANQIKLFTEDITAVELMPQNATELKRLGYLTHEKDFLTMDVYSLGVFDRIVANPPFTKNQDIDHIKHMYSFLTRGGRLVSVASTSWTFGSQKKQVAFREWLDEVGAEVREIPAGAFKKSGTNVSSVIVIIDRTD